MTKAKRRYHRIKISPYRRLENELANARCALGNAVDKFMESERVAARLLESNNRQATNLLSSSEALARRQELLDRMARTDQGIRDALGETLHIIDAMQKEAGWRLLPGPMVQRLEEIRRLL